MKTSTRGEIETLQSEVPATHSQESTAATESRTSSPMLPGSVLLERFEVRARLGSGGMGVVYEAFDRELGTAAALKFLHRSGPRALYRLKQEFRAMNALGPHPNLIAPNGLFCEHGLWFVSMELVRGEPLLRYVRPADRLDPDRIRAALVQLVQGLHAMHAEGKVHRDLKPSNVLVTGQGRVVILDFGLVSDGEVEVEAGGAHRMSGTPRYMAPEQARGEPATEASDFYAVGVMLYEALTGLSPFECDSVDTLIGKQQRDPPSPSALVSELPGELAALCTELLSREPAERPLAAEVLQALGHPLEVAAGATPGRARAELVGRDEELAVLRAALRRTDRGAPQLVLVEGQSAVGKTALLQAFIATVPSSTVALSSRCHVRADVPFKALDELVDELTRFLGRVPAEDAQRWAPLDLDALVQMFPVLARVDALKDVTRRGATAGEHELRRRGAAALRELLNRIAAEQPLVVFIDDLQWGDADSATLLRELLRMPGAPPLLLIGVHRSEARDSQFIASVRGLATEAGIELQTLALEPLPQGEAEQLARRLLGDVQDQALVATVAREAGGMPLFVRELSTQARQGLLGGHCAGGMLSTAIARRVDTLPRAARAVLDLVSIAHAPLPEAVILDAAQLGEDATTPVRRLCAESLLRVVSDGRLDAYHDRVRESVAERIDAEHKRALHAQLVAALQHSARAQPDWLAAHAVSAGLRDIGLVASMDAADGAMKKLAFEHAAAHYRTALGLLAEDDPQRGDLFVQLGDACRLDGRGRDAGEAYVQASEHITGSRHRDLLRRASEVYLYSGYIDRGIEIMVPVLESLGLSFPKQRWHFWLSLVYELIAAKLARLLYREREESTLDETALARIDACYSLGTGLLSLDEATGLTMLFLVRCSRLALQAGAARRVAFADCVVAGMPKGSRGYDVDSRPVFERALELARRFDDKQLEAWTYTNAGIGNLFAGRGARAIEYAIRCRQVCEQSGIFAGLTVVGAERAHQIGCMLNGRIHELAEVGPEYARRAHARADLFAWSTSLIYSSLPMLAADDSDRALAQLAEAVEGETAREHLQRWRASSGLPLNFGHALLLQTWALLYRGDGTQAYTQLLRLWPALQGRGYLKVPGWCALYHHCRGIAALAAARDGRTHARALLRDARRSTRTLRRLKSMAAAAPFADLVSAGLSAVDGDRVGAHACLSSAAHEFDAMEMDLFAAAARRRLGELTGGPEGSRMQQAADERMRSLGVAAPERWTAMYAADFERPQARDGAT